MIATCIKCEKPFRYRHKGRKRVVCPRCLNANLAESVRRIRQRTKRTANEESNYSLHADGISKLDQEEVGKLMGITRSAVGQLERNAFVKVRNHPEASALWHFWKEEGCPTVEASDADIGRQLLEWNLSLSEWWGLYDEIYEKPGLEMEARECLQEIAKFFKLLKRAIVPQLT